MGAAHTSISPCRSGFVIPGTAPCARPMRWPSSGVSLGKRVECRPTGWLFTAVGRSHVFDHGAVDFVRHVLQAVHHTLKVAQNFRGYPEVERALRSLHLKEAAARGIMQVVCLALDLRDLFRQAADL